MPKKLPVVANTSPLIALSAALADFDVLGFAVRYAFASSARCAQTFSKALTYWPISSGTSP